MGLFSWLKKHKKNKENYTNSNPSSNEQINKEQDFRNVLGKYGEQGYFNLLTYNTKIWEKLNYHLYNYRTTFNKQTPFTWLNQNNEEFYPFDFIINGSCNKDKYFNITINPLNNQEIVLIDVKTTGQKSERFFRSNSEIEKINELLAKNQNVTYLICVIFITYFDASKPFQDVLNWKIRYFNLQDLQKIEVARNNDGASYFYDLNSNLLP